MNPDPIIEEVYRAKDELAREVGNDVGKLFDLLREEAKKYPERLVCPNGRPAKLGQRLKKKLSGYVKPQDGNG